MEGYLQNNNNNLATTGTHKMEGNDLDVCVQWRDMADEVRVTKPAGKRGPLVVVDLHVAFTS